MCKHLRKVAPAVEAVITSLLFNANYRPPVLLFGKTKQKIRLEEQHGLSQGSSTRLFTDKYTVENKRFEFKCQVMPLLDVQLLFFYMIAHTPLCQPDIL